MWLLKMKFLRYVTSLAVQWLRLCTSNAGDMGLIFGWGTKDPTKDVVWCRKQTNKETKIKKFTPMFIAALVTIARLWK